MVSACGGGSVNAGGGLSLGGSSATTASAGGGQSSSGGLSSTASTSAGAKSTAPGVTSGSSGKAVTACPSASVLSSASGNSYQLEKNLSAGGYLTCAYTDSHQGALTIVGTTLPAGSVSAAELKQVAQGQAQAQKTSVTEVSGIGDAAFSFTEPSGVGSPNGVAATTLIVLTGNQELVVGGDATPAQTEAIARAVLK